MSTFLSAYMPAYLPAYQPACLPACLPSCQSAYLPNYLPVHTDLLINIHFCLTDVVSLHLCPQLSRLPWKRDKDRSDIYKKPAAHLDQVQELPVSYHSLFLPKETNLFHFFKMFFLSPLSYGLLNCGIFSF